jgi:hypothetical protein
MPYIITQGFLSSASTVIRQGYSVAPIVPIGALGLFGAIITKMEAVNVGDSLGEPGLFEPGTDVISSPLKTIISNMENY